MERLLLKLDSTGLVSELFYFQLGFSFSLGQVNLQFIRLLRSFL